MTDSAHLQKDLARVALGDRAAFARVYQATSAHLFGVALRILNRRDVAEDVLQEAFVSVWHHAGSYQAASGQPMTWMISIVRNKALDVVRSAAVRHETEMPMTAEGEAIDVQDERPSPLQLLTQATDAMAPQSPAIVDAGDRSWRFAAVWRRSMRRIGNAWRSLTTRACRTPKWRHICALHWAVSRRGCGVGLND